MIIIQSIFPQKQHWFGKKSPLVLGGELQFSRGSKVIQGLCLGQQLLSSGCKSVLGRGHSLWHFTFAWACFQFPPVSPSGWPSGVVAPRAWRPHRLSPLNQAVFEWRPTHLHIFQQKSELFILLVFSPSVSTLHHNPPPPPFQVAHCVGYWRTLVIIAADCCRGNLGLHILPGIPTQ